MLIGDLQTPALVVDKGAFERNVATMSSRWPAERLRPHVKAFKSTDLARQLAAAGHRGFCCATPREVIGMAAAGLGHDLLLANETVDADRLAAMSRCSARVTVAVDSAETIAAAAAAGIGEVLIDVNVGLPRCGCEAGDAGRLADSARGAGLSVRGVMGYEGHVVGIEDRVQRSEQTQDCMAILSEAHGQVGGDVVSGGGTGTWDLNSWVTELQAGSFTLMDTAYAKLALGFEQAVAVAGTVISVNRSTGFAVADVGLKALGMDHGNPTVRGATVWFCSDEHITFGPEQQGSHGPGDAWPALVGDRVLVWPAHIDPTISQHEAMHVTDDPLHHDGASNLDAAIIDRWAVDLRSW